MCFIKYKFSLHVCDYGPLFRKSDIPKLHYSPNATDHKPNPTNRNSTNADLRKSGRSE